MSVHWNKTNRAFTDRISEAQDAHRNLKSNLILTKNVSTSRPSFHQLLHYLVDVDIFLPQTIALHFIEDIFLGKVLKQKVTESHFKEMSSKLLAMKNDQKLPAFFISSQQNTEVEKV